MINTSDMPEQGDDEIADKCFTLSPKMAGYDEDSLKVEGLINGDRWFAVSWTGEEFMCNISRTPMCRDDFWEWASKKRKSWFKAPSDRKPTGDLDMPVIVSVMASLIHAKRRTLKIKLLDA